ncbi:MAG: response regulator, partial [Phycisphaerae bacterium]|nr:response regulator [Phycisphaerae bacterium]
MGAKRIVIVEDDKGFRKVMEAALRKHGYEVLAADNGTEGEQMIRECDPALAIMDVMMPGKNGLDICQDLKKSEEHRAIPILMMTCMTEESEKDD